MDSVIGIDLSGLSRATKGRTVAAHVALENPLRLVELVTIRPGIRGDADLLGWIRDREPRVVGIDAPLTLPHSVLCEVDDCERCQPGHATYLGRDVDRMAGGMPTVMLAAIAFRGIYLARQLRLAGVEVIEVYPGASYAAWGVRRGSNQERSEALARRIGNFDWTNRDQLDAVCAAIASADWYHGTAQQLSGVDGSIAVAT